MCSPANPANSDGPSGFGVESVVESCISGTSLSCDCDGAGNATGSASNLCQGEAERRRSMSSDWKECWEEDICEPWPRGALPSGSRVWRACSAGRRCKRLSSTSCCCCARCFSACSGFSGTARLCVGRGFDFRRTAGCSGWEAVSAETFRVRGELAGASDSDRTPLVRSLCAKGRP